MWADLLDGWMEGHKYNNLIPFRGWVAFIGKFSAYNSWVQRVERGGLLIRKTNKRGEEKVIALPSESGPVGLRI